MEAQKLLVATLIICIILVIAVFVLGVWVGETRIQIISVLGGGKQP